MIGAAIKGGAAQLATDAGINTETVAKLLARSRAGVRVLDSKTVLIVDEASTISNRDLLSLCELAIETGATVRLIGDNTQHGSVAASGTFAELAVGKHVRYDLADVAHWLADRRVAASGAGRLDQEYH